MKIIILFLCFLLVGCQSQAQEPLEEPLKISTIFNQPIKPYEERMGYSVLIPRLNHVLQEDWTMIHVVMDREDEAIADDFIINEEQSQQVKELLWGIQWDEEKKIKANHRMALEISFQKKEPVILKITNEGVFYTENDYIAFQEPIPLYEMLLTMKSDIQEVLALNFDEGSSNCVSWADEWDKEPAVEEIKKEHENEIDLLPDEDESEWEEVLRLAFFVEQDFEDYHEIEKWNRLVAGLAMLNREKGYLSCGEIIGPYGDQGEIYFQKEETGMHCDTLINEHLVEEKGKEVLGEDFVFPMIESGKINEGIIFGADYEAEQKLIQLAEPYELYQPQFPTLLIQTLIEHDQVKEYDVLFYIPSFEYNDENQTDYTIHYMNENGDVFDQIQGNEDQFRQAHIVLQETANGIRFVSFKTTHSIISEIEKPNEENKEEIVENEMEEIPQGSEIE